MAETTEKLECAIDARRRILNIAVSTVLLETGFGSCDKMALETLTEILQSCKYCWSYEFNYWISPPKGQEKYWVILYFIIITVLSEVGNSARGYCEISGRVEPVLGDVIMALINMGKYVT